MSSLSRKHFIDIQGATKEDLNKVIDTGFTFREVLDRRVKKVPSLSGINIANLFFENSTRTKLSFELAEKRLSADVINFSASSSSINKGETFKDTVQNILGGLRSSCTYVGAPSLKQLSKCTTFVRVNQQYNDTFE